MSKSKTSVDLVVQQHDPYRAAIKESKLLSEYQLQLMGYFLLREKRPTRTIANEYGDVNVINADGVTTFAHWMYLPADTIAWRPIIEVERLPGIEDIRAHGYTPFSVARPTAKDFVTYSNMNGRDWDQLPVVVLFADKMVQNVRYMDLEYLLDVHPIRTALGWKRAQLFTLLESGGYKDMTAPQKARFLRDHGFKKGAKITDEMREAGTIEVITRTGHVQVWDLETIKRKAAAKASIVGWKAVKPFNW